MLFNRTRIAVRRAKRNAETADQAAACDKVLASEEMLGAVEDQLKDDHAASGSVTTFLDWLLANLPQILAAAMAVVALFS